MLGCFFIHGLVAVSAMSYLRSDANRRPPTVSTQSYFHGTVVAQDRCKTQDLSAAERDGMRLTLAATSNLFSSDSQARSIAVFFHILTSLSGAETVSDSQINDQVAVLNSDFSNSGSKFAFVLAGIDRTANDFWYTAAVDSEYEGAMKAALRQGTYMDLNIYTTAQVDGTLGWATYPKHVVGDFTADGVVVDYRTLPGSESSSNNQGHMLTHEVGHWLGLFHTFQGGCVADPDGGDEIGDTPAVQGPNTGCPAATKNSCPGNDGGLQGNDPIHNYMDYTDDSCMNNFTPGQVDRMHHCWGAFRAE